MIELINRASELFSYKTPFVIATIIYKNGSSPREEGTSMIVTERGLDIGTIGGGAAEYEAIEFSKKLILDEKSDNHKYVLTNNDAESIGMICGGVNIIHFEYVSPDDFLAGEYFLKIIEEYKNKDVNLLYSTKGNAGFSVEIEDEVYQFTRSEINEKIECDFKIKIEDKFKVFIFGGGHVSKALVPILNYLNLETIVIEDREEFLKEEDFPNSKRILLNYFDLENLEITENDYVCILTRGHKSDREILVKMLEKRPYYIGIIGSRKKAEIMFNSIRGKYDESLINRVHSPIGLSIGAQTPEEISISIAAQIIEKFRNR
ncbi:XdhC family protein [Peptoniphilus mikwangii]|uniref:XdhC family protein n=1 Tax=Peptoniphilus mikwangii TaxID=1354300 RepID=UPI00042020E6|nr:XdhC/CoxI family protein [Peptoniphilus mikwangii]